MARFFSPRLGIDASGKTFLNPIAESQFPPGAFIVFRVFRGESDEREGALALTRVEMAVAAGDLVAFR